MATFQCFYGHVENRQVVSHEEGVKLGPLKLLDELLEVGEVEAGVRICAWVTPCAGMKTDRAYEAVRCICFLCADIASGDVEFPVFAAISCGSEYVMLRSPLVGRQS